MLGAFLILGLLCFASVASELVLSTRMLSCNALILTTCIQHAYKPEMQFQLVCALQMPASPVQVWTIKTDVANTSLAFSGSL